MNGSYALMMQRHGGGCYARVPVVVESAAESSITCAPDVETYVPILAEDWNA